MIRLDIWVNKQQKVILEALKKRDGIPISEQVRRAIDLYIREREKSEHDRRNME